MLGEETPFQDIPPRLCRVEGVSHVYADDSLSVRLLCKINAQSVLSRYECTIPLP